MHTYSELQRLISTVVPHILCPEGCSLCCDNIQRTDCIEQDIPGTQYEFSFGKTQSALPEACDRLQNGKCSVYEHRSIKCLLWYKTEIFGPCLKGKIPEYLLTPEEIRRIMWCWRYGTIQDARALVALMRKYD